METKGLEAVDVRRITLDDGLVRPYGGRLVQAYVPAQERQALIARMRSFPQIDLADGELHDLEMLASGAYSPLAGFMNRDAYESVRDSQALPDGLVWGLPVTLAATREAARGLQPGQPAALCYRGHPVGIIEVEDVYPWDPSGETRAVHPGAEQSHPTAAERHAREARYLVGGPVLLLASRTDPYLQQKHQWPLETRRQFSLRGWQDMAAVHVRNPWKRVHEYLLKCALESNDALLLHSVIDASGNDGSVSHEIIADASALLLKTYFPSDRIIANRLPAHLVVRSTRAAIQHAILAQNYGCSSIYLIDGADANGAASRVDGIGAAFTRAATSGLEIRPVFMRRAFHCDACGGVATEKSCPHDATRHIDLSDTDIHQKLVMGEHLPPLVTRPEIARALARGVSQQIDPAKVKRGGRHLFPHAGEVSRELRQALSGHKACCLWMTGLSGSGKSTIAHRLERELLLSGHRVFVLDGDTLRHGLNRDLGFTDESRRENLRRAGEVAKLMVEAGMIVIASFITPFQSERKVIREMLDGRFYEVYVEASLEVCEQRDPKGLYKRARAGQIESFTGISSPYEPPVNPEVKLNTGVHGVDECLEQLIQAMTQGGLLRAASAERISSRRRAVYGADNIQVQ